MSRVAEADPALPGDDVRAAVERVAADGATLRSLARAVELSPKPLLDGAPVTVGRLVVELRAQGSALPDPACVRCGRTGRGLTASEEGGPLPTLQAAPTGLRLRPLRGGQARCRS